MEQNTCVMADEGNEESALVEWRLDNFGCWNEDFHDKVIVSPQIEVYSSFTCTLELYPKGLTGCDDHLLLRVIYNTGHRTKGEVTFIGSDGNLLCTSYNESFPSGYSVVIFPPGPKIADVVKKLRKHLPWHRDRLTLRLRVQNLGSSINRVRTKIKAIDNTFKIHRLVSDDYWTHGIRALPPLVPIAEVPSFQSEEGTVGMALQAECKNRKVVKLKFRQIRDSRFTVPYLNDFMVHTRLCVLQNYDVVVSSEDNEHRFVNEREWVFCMLTKEQVLKPGISLLLRVKIIPRKGYEHGSVVEYFPSRLEIVPTFRTEHHLASVHRDSERDEHSTEALVRELASLYQDREFCDFELRCGNVEFPVHRNILAARSPVFRTMLSSDMRESASGCMSIEDLDPSTLALFLEFLYSGMVADLQGESALKLYYAADKYQLPTLKRDCADFLIANVSNSDVCDVLSFGDRHQDHRLYSAALDFITKKYNAVLISKEWDIFMDREPELAARVVSLMAENRGS